MREVMMMADSCVLEGGNFSPGGSENLATLGWLEALHPLLPNSKSFAGPMMLPSDAACKNKITCRAYTALAVASDATEGWLIPLRALRLASSRWVLTQS